ncbi:MAG: hypothetical protein QM767_29360 [Anaeromyxobacter sp.]
MPLEPAFMAQRAAFDAELEQVRTPQQWMLFRKKWFADQPWPVRSPEELAAASGDGAPRVLGGRTFHPAPLPLDVTPEARHAYFQALAKGFAAMYPDDAPGQGGSSIRWTCAACEQYSDEPGDPACPSCGRPLVAMRFAPNR